MTITQTVEIPVSHILTIDVPREVPAGRAILAFTPASRECVDDETHNRKPISAYFGIHSYGDGVEALPVATGVPVADDISAIFDGLRVDLTGHKFDRDKANDYE